MPIEATLPRGRANHLQQLFWLRNAVLATQGIAAVIAIYGVGIDLPLAPLAGVLAMMVAVNVATGIHLARGGPVTEAKIAAQILFDLAALSALLFFSGGSTNPFTALYLLPLAFAAMTLPNRLLWIVVALSATCYGLLLFYHVPLTSVTDSHEKMMTVHVVGMWLTFLISAMLIAYFVAGIRGRDALIADIREAALRDERILAIGTLAAGAAHELSTPLSTIAVLARELEDEHAGNAALVADLSLLRRQVETCKHTIAHLLTAAGQQRLEDATVVSAPEFVKEVLAKWQLMRPLAHLENTLACDEPEPWIVADATLSQALINILNNAADASPDHVEINTHWNSHEVIVDVRDRGQGLQGDALKNAGQAFFSTKAPESGRGLGLFLAHAVIERFGGSLRMHNRDGGGLSIQIVLPIAKQAP